MSTLSPLPPLRVQLLALAAEADPTIDLGRLEGLLIGARDAGMPWRDIGRATTDMIWRGYTLHDLDNAFEAWRRTHAQQVRHALAQARGDRP